MTPLNDKLSFSKFRSWILLHTCPVSSYFALRLMCDCPSTRTKVFPRAWAGYPRNISSVIIVRAREAFRGNGNNSRFESSTSLSAFDERAHARSLCTRIDLSSRRRLGDGARFRESSDREGPADHKCTPEPRSWFSAPRAYVCTCVYV